MNETSHALCTAENHWLQTCRQLFALQRPAVFGNAGHCCECAEHEAVLQGHNPDNIGLAQLGNPGWDPLCYCSAQGIRYYFPALVRLALDARDENYYLDQLLFHLLYDGPDNRLLGLFSPQQRDYVANFLTFLMETRAAQIEQMGDASQLLEAILLWQHQTA